MGIKIKTKKLSFIKLGKLMFFHIKNQKTPTS